MAGEVFFLSTYSVQSNTYTHFGWDFEEFKNTSIAEICPNYDRIGQFKLNFIFH